MIKFEKKIETVSYEVINVDDGVYYFERTSDDTTTFRKYTILKDSVSLISVLNGECEKSIRYGEYADDWTFEQCFTGGKSTTVIPESKFIQEFSSVLDFLKELQIKL